ncbi:MAG: DUF2993 domain-containing protein [Cyanobacteria bacterium M_surface_7_m2_040]|nr:DUF2993 domain-containing protein [Cyanobacteria bacterium M_surface_7_m2_040]
MASDKQASGPVMQLLASGLQLWVRQQCQSVDSLDIDLQGSALGLLRGRLEGVQLLARRAVYQHLPIEQVQLVSSAISVHMGNLLKGQPLQLEQPFQVEGQLSFTAEGLSCLFADSHWQWLADLLTEQLFGTLHLHALRIEAQQLVFVLRGSQPGEQLELRVLVRAAAGTIELVSPAGESLLRLPMDPGITIERAWVDAGMLQLSGQARVSP